MKIILSRKGFDSGYGGYPSPILPNGELISLPIPDDTSTMKYHSLAINQEMSYHDIMSQLIGDKIKLENHGKFPIQSIGCHLDPDIRFETINRLPNWKGLFGQVSGSQTHLEKQGVTKGDIFLFFGWFRKTIYQNHQLKYDPNDKTGKHMIYGYMQISEINNINKTKFPDWMLYHPHIDRESNTENDTIYVANDYLNWNSNIKGYGTFNYHDHLVLTKAGMSKSKWNLPSIFQSVNISFHTEKSWKENYFQSAAKGQEFVVDANTEVEKWVKNLIENCS